MEEKPTPGYYGHRQGDKAGTATLDFSVGANAVVHLDYNSTSIGMDFGNGPVCIRKIVLTPDEDHTTHRITGQTIELYKGDTYYQYEQILADEFIFEKDENGVITITLNEVLESRYVKVNVLFDERDRTYTPEDRAEFINTLAAMLAVYSEATNRTEEYEYDKAGNRTLQRVTLVQTDEYASMYYTNSNRLKTDGTYAFEYDQAGNMVKKGNAFEIDGDEVTFTATDGEGVEYWEYVFDLLNRLTEVTKNGTLVAEYIYDVLGYRVAKRSNGEKTHYVFEGTEAIFEKNITTGEIKSYVYALGKHMARVDGVIGDSTENVYYYHNDHLGSVRAVSDGSGEVVWSADYLAFGRQVDRDSQGFSEWHGFTGKELDEDVNLYYYNARWYDASIGRFITSDPVAAGLNWYVYCSNNPLTRIDPTGLEDYNTAHYHLTEEQIKAYRETGKVHWAFKRYYENRMRISKEIIKKGIPIYKAHGGEPVPDTVFRGFFTGPQYNAGMFLDINYRKGTYLEPLDSVDTLAVDHDDDSWNVETWQPHTNPLILYLGDYKLSVRFAEGVVNTVTAFNPYTGKHDPIYKGYEEQAHIFANLGRMAFDHRAKNNTVDWYVSRNKGEATLTTQEAIDAFELYTWFIQNYDNLQKQGINVQLDVINEIVPGYIKNIRIGSIYDQTNQENKREVIQDEEK